MNPLSKKEASKTSCGRRTLEEKIENFFLVGGKKGGLVGCPMGAPGNPSSSSGMFGLILFWGDFF